MVAVLLPSVGMDPALVDTVNEAAVGVLLEDELLEDELLLADELLLEDEWVQLLVVDVLPPVVPPLKLPQPSLLPLPQPASARVSTNRAMIDTSLRMFLLPES